MTMRRVHYLDPQLLGLEGHYFHYCEQAVGELGRRGIPVSVYGRRGTSLVCAGVPVQPVFSREIFAEAWSDPETWALENYHNLNRAFLADLLQLPPDRFTAEDIVFLPSLIENQLHGVAQWLARLPAGRRPPAVILFRFLNQSMEYIRARPHHELVRLHYRHASRALARVEPRSLFCADTLEMAEAFREATGLPVHPVPVAMGAQPGAASAPAPRPEAGPVVAFLGHTSKLRGFHLLPEIIERCLEASSPARFVIQVQSRSAAAAEKLEAVLGRLDALSRGGVRLVEGALSSERYYSLLAEADVILLPYAPAFYGHCSSGIFAEAAAAGKVIVVPAGTVGARLGEEYGLGVVAGAGWNPKSSAAAVDQALKNLPAHRARAATGAARFAREQGVEAFWDQVAAVPEAAAAG